MATTAEAFDQATLLGRQERDEYSAARAYFDKRIGKMVVELENGYELAFPPALIQGLDTATEDDLDDVELSPSGLGLHFPSLDIDLSVPALFHQQTGNRNWMAKHMGRAGGAVVSSRKAAAARENGRRGGRPKASSS
jgi:hypothetical protein